MNDFFVCKPSASSHENVQGKKKIFMHIFFGESSLFVQLPFLFSSFLVFEFFAPLFPGLPAPASGGVFNIRNQSARAPKISSAVQFISTFLFCNF